MPPRRRPSGSPRRPGCGCGFDRLGGPAGGADPARLLRSCDVPSSRNFIPTGNISDLLRVPPPSTYNPIDPQRSTTMKYAIIGAGNVGGAVARAVTAAGHQAVVAATSTDKLDALAQDLGVQTTTSNRDAAAGADVVVLTVPFDAVAAIAADLRAELDGTVVIDATNPLAADLSGLSTSGTSAAELVQQAAPGARVVKAFNTAFASNQADPQVEGTRLDGFLAGDDDEAKQTVSDLLSAVGYRPIDVGGLSAARYLEGLAFLNIALNARNGWAWQSGWKLVGPTG
ncbi:MAG TPA: NADPH-dependent F420 reductase [Euzebya sp.]|nr:NADPH-dependent F420 reductase [Euzebya sp.]